MRTLDKILGRIQRRQFPLPGGRHARIGFSAGVVEVGERASPARVIDEADRLLYLAKTAGGSRIFPEESPSLPLKARILLVDEDMVSAALVAGLLEAEGYETHRCADPAAALQEAMAFQPSLVLLEVAFPGEK